MDLIDKKIICIMGEDCRTPLSQIGKRLRINRNVVGYRINNMIKEGIIIKSICSVDLGKLGYQTYKIYLKIKKLHKEVELINYLRLKNEVIHLISHEGEYNLAFVIVCKEVRELDYFLTELKSRFETVIKDFHVSIVIYSRIFKLEKLLLEKRFNEYSIDSYTSAKEIVALDEIDKKILHNLSQDAEISYVSLAKNTGLSLDIIKYRMKKLRKEIISSFRLAIDLSKFGFYHYVILLKTSQMTKNDEQKLITWNTHKKNVLYFTKRIGDYDFEVNVAIKDINDLNRFIRDLEIEFGEKIDSYSDIIVNKVIKLDYIPF